MFHPHYVSLPEAAPAAPTTLEGTTKVEEDNPMAEDVKKENGGQLSSAAANTSIATSNSTAVSSSGMGGGVGAVSQHSMGGGNVHQPQVSGTIRPSQSTTIPNQAAQQGQFTLNSGMHRPGPGATMNHMMMNAGRGMGRGMMGGATAIGGGMNRMTGQGLQQAGMPPMSRMKLEQIRAQNLMHLQQQQQQIRGGVQYPPGTAPMMGNPPPNYRSPMGMNPAGMPPGPGRMGMTTHDATPVMQHKIMLMRHQQAQQMHQARLQQLQLQRQRAAMMAAGGYHGQSQQFAMRSAPMQANPPMQMGHVMQAPQQPQYVQQAPGPGMMMAPGGPRGPPGQPPMGYQPGMNPNMPGQPPMYR